MIWKESTQVCHLSPGLSTPIRHRQHIHHSAGRVEDLHLPSSGSPKLYCLGNGIHQRSMMDTILHDPDPTTGHLESVFSDGGADLKGEWHVLS
jgi:hypothetical protein